MSENQRKLIPALIYKSLDGDLSVCRFDKKVRFLKNSKRFDRKNSIEIHEINNNNNNENNYNFVSSVYLIPKFDIQHCDDNLMSESIDGEIYRSAITISPKYEINSNFTIKPEELDHCQTWKSTIKFFIEDTTSSNIQIPMTPQVFKFRNHILFKD